MNLAEQRCWNHERREAACRCPDCRRYFCRECVTEHQQRLLCAACLRQATEGATRRHGRTFGAVVPVVAAALLCWLWFLAVADALIGFRPSVETTQWERR